VITLTEEQLQEPYFITSIIFIGKITQKKALDNNLYDGFAIGVRGDDEDMKLYDTPAAWLIEEDSGTSAVVIKVAAMPWLWAFGDRRTNREATWHDGHQDRASVLENGRLPLRYLLVRFPRSIYLKNIMAPFRQNWTNRRIDRSIDVSLARDGRVIQESDVAWGDPTFASTSREYDERAEEHITVRNYTIRGVKTVTQGLRSHIEVYFHVAKASESAARQADVFVQPNPERELDDVYSSFASPSGPRSSSFDASM
jgi:hypothetical protein